jgi:large subunit ribosomal protein L29
MKASEVHSYADPQVVELVGNKRQELFNLRFQHATGQLEDTAGLQRAKRDLARALTIARERGIDVEVELAKQRNAEEKR